MIKQFSIGQQVRITDLNHPMCGEFVSVRSVHADGKAGMGTPLRFPGRWISFTVDQVCCARPMLFGDDALPEASRASHYS